MPLVVQISLFGALLTQRIEAFGRFTRFCASTFLWTFRRSGGHGRIRLLIPQLYSIGTLSIPVVMLVGAFVGMVLAVETYDQFAAIGQESRLGGIINISVVKQIGPVLAAVMIAGRVGGAVSAELGTMRVTEQIDALRVMGSDPIAHLVVPRVLACVLMVPLLTVISDLVGIAGGYLVTVQGYGVSGRDYWEFSARFINNWDVSTGLIKSIVFGLMIGLISCYKGFFCGSGAAGVGRAATDAFVTSFITIIMMNFFIAMILKPAYYLIFGYDGPTAFSG